ncbi:MAG: prepilin-type N-terminal cleavage/methylation domain-containing protein [Phycisphaeraceae bacterium]
MRPDHVSARTHRPGFTPGFTLVEILIVVVILGILAAIVIPQFANATEEAKINTIKQDVHRIRIQLEIYRGQHLDKFPTLAAFEDQMTKSSRATGATAEAGTAGYPHGPYLRSLPENPMSGGHTIGDGAVGTSDWYYNQSTGEFRANDSAESRTY